LEGNSQDLQTKCNFVSASSE